MSPRKYGLLAMLLSCLGSGAKASSEESIVLAGGCFWGVEAVFEHVKGVTQAVSGYAGGEAATADYDMVSGGATGHAESVRVTYDPQQVTLERLLDVYFAAAHNPTQLNYQGPDHGTQYRSAIFYATPEQKQAAEIAIAKLTRDKLYGEPIVTTLEKLRQFYPAEDYHQDFAARNPMHPYILMHDRPKVVKLKEAFPALYKE